MIADPRVRGVSLTGSERAGAAVAEIAGRNLKKVVLELGGSDPFILLGTDDLDATVEAAVGGRLENTGQACNAAKRFIVADELYEPFLEKFTAALTAVKPGRPDLVGDDDRPAVLGHRDRAARRPGQARRRPGRRARGRRRARGQLLPDHDPDRHQARAWTPTTRSSSARSPRSTASAPRTRRSQLANDTPFGLGSYVMTNDPDQAMRVADQIDAGMVFVNAVGAGGRRAAVRRRQALGLRPRARPLRRRRVRQQEDDPGRRLSRPRPGYRLIDSPGRCLGCGGVRRGSARLPDRVLFRQRGRACPCAGADRQAPVRPRQPVGRVAAARGRRDRLPRAPRLGALRRGFLGLTTEPREETKARYAFVFGDFRRIHRSGIIACHYRAAEWRHKAIELAAHDLLQELDAHASR